MGEQGFIGLALFLMLGLFALSTCSRIIKQTKHDPEMQWMRNLAAMMQVSLIGYAVSGAFLGLAYFDYYYALLAIVVGMTVVLHDHLKQQDSITFPVAEPASSVSGYVPKPAAGLGSPSSLKIREWIEFGKRFYERL
jgi:hypothetical protein